jgi:dTDP-glucose 4,6-dehydratase
LIFVAGGCGFIGSNFVLDWLATNSEPVIVLDKLTYAGNIHNFDSIKNNSLLTVVKGDINDRMLLDTLINQHKPRAILNFAAESHVDRSIQNPSDFITTNIQGTFQLLEAARHYWAALNHNDKSSFRFLQISTDEVYGSLAPDAPAFCETNAYLPNNPYSASKASSDHLVRAYHHTYGLGVLITNCSNNYGPYQFPEKLIPLTILNALQGKPLFIYGDGLQIRDWLYVTDHCSAIRTVLDSGVVGETYNIGGCNEISNLAVVKTICDILDELMPCSQYAYASLVRHITDRPGHDRRYAIDASKIQQDLGWHASETFESGIRKTVLWYLNNEDWVATTKKNENLQQWLETNYEGRQ